MRITIAQGEDGGMPLYFIEGLNDHQYETICRALEVSPENSASHVLFKKLNRMRLRSGE